MPSRTKIVGEDEDDADGQRHDDTICQTKKTIKTTDRAMMSNRLRVPSSMGEVVKLVLVKTPDAVRWRCDA